MDTLEFYTVYIEIKSCIVSKRYFHFYWDYKKSMLIPIKYTNINATLMSNTYKLEQKTKLIFKEWNCKTKLSITIYFCVALRKKKSNGKKYL